MEREQGTARSVFICYTKYQIFNVLNLVFHDVNQTLHTSDLFVEKSISDLEKIMAELRDKELFSNIYMFSGLNIKIRFLRKAYVGLCLLAPSLALQNSIIGKFGGKKKNYDMVYASTLGIFVINMIHHCKGTVFLFEDGTDSYDGNIQNRLPELYRRLLKIKNSDNLGIQALYLNDIEFCSENEESQVLSLPQISGDLPFLELCKNVFSYTGSSQYPNYRFIYLHMPMELVYHTVAVNDETFLVAPLLLQSLLIRMHPSSKGGGPCNTVPIDYGENIWELECLYSITDRHVLISCYSTAMFMPKLLFDKEPALVFTYKLWGIRQKGYDLDNIERLISKLDKIYVKKNCVFVPETLNEYHQIIEKLTQEEERKNG